MLDNHAPMKVFQTRRNYNPWLSDDTKVLIKQREELKEQAAQDGKQETFNEYKKLRNRIKKILKKEEPKYYENKFDELVNIRDVWRTVDSVLGSSRDMSPSQITVNGELISNPKKMAEIFNDTFRNKIEKLRNSLKR